MQSSVYQPLVKLENLRVRSHLILSNQGVRPCDAERLPPAAQSVPNAAVRELLCAGKGFVLDQLERRLEFCHAQRWIARPAAQNAPPTHTRTSSENASAQTASTEGLLPSLYDYILAIIPAAQLTCRTPPPPPLSMLSPNIRKDIDDLLSEISELGSPNPIAAVEQITLLISLARFERLNEHAGEGWSPFLYGPRSVCRLDHHSDDRIDGVPGRNDCPGHTTCRWSHIVGVASRGEDVHDVLARFVFPWIRELHAIPDLVGLPKPRVGSPEAAILSLAVQMRDASLTIQGGKPESLNVVIQIVDRLFADAEIGVAGEAFEHLLHQIKATGEWGQFWTPRHLARFMVALLDPRPGEALVDPAAGTGGFLVETIRHLQVRETERTSPDAVRLEWDGTPHGILRPNEIGHDLGQTRLACFDADPTMARIGWMNLSLHGILAPEVHCADVLRTGPFGEQDFDVVLTNPPFGGRSEIEAGDWASIESRQAVVGSRDALFLLLGLELLRSGGRAAVVVPEGFLFGAGSLQVEIREHLLFQHWLEGVISLPAVTFKPYTSVKTAILVFRKEQEPSRPFGAPRTDSVWFYEVTADGFSSSSRRTPHSEPNDLWDALEKWRTKPVTSLDYFQPELHTESNPHGSSDETASFPFRPRQVSRQDQPLRESKCWTAPVRRFAVRPDWESEDGLLHGSHGTDGHPRPEFVHDFRIYEDAAGRRVRQEYLDPACIEANAFNLSAARYRPSTPAQHYPPPAELIRRLRAAELDLVSELDVLLAMLEEHA